LSKTFKPGIKTPRLTRKNLLIKNFKVIYGQEEFTSFPAKTMSLANKNTSPDIKNQKLN